MSTPPSGDIFVYNSQSFRFIEPGNNISINKNAQYKRGEVYVLPMHLDEKVASYHLEGVLANLTRLSEEQAAYLGLPIDGPYKPNHYRY